VCDLCDEMGPKSKERFLEWKGKKNEAKSKSASSSQYTSVATAKSGQINVSGNADNQAVSHAELKAFGASLAADMRNMFAEMLQANTQPASSVVGQSSGDVISSGAQTASPQQAQGFDKDTDDVLRVNSLSDDGFDDEEEDDTQSVRSWDHKRRGAGSNGNEETESVLDEAEEEDSGPSSSNESEKYVQVITEIIAALDIEDAVKVPKSKSRIVSSRCKDQRAQALLPFDEHHIDTIDKVWGRDVASMRVYKKSTKDRYHLAEKDFDKYLRVSSVKDEYLVQELEKAGIKVHSRYPKLQDKNLAQLESKVGRIETQSQLGMACAISQSWMLQYLNTQLDKLDAVLKSGLGAEDYKSISEQVNLNSLKDVSVLAQDAAMDALDLQAREAAGAKWIRRSLWVDQTRWSTSLKAAIKQFPITGDGTLCGPLLKDKLESYRVTSKALDATRSVSATSGRGQKAGKRGGQVSGGPPPKQFKLNYDRPVWDGNVRGRGRGRGRPVGSFRGQSRGSGQATFAKPSTSTG
jgi:hypothetical protein